MERSPAAVSANGQRRNRQALRAGSRTRKGSILFALCLAALIINVDVTIVNVTLPSLVRQLKATTTNLQWVVDAYTLVFAALILAAGSLSDRVGRKGVLLLGLAVFGAGSLAGSLGQTPGQLIAARALMGIGAAGIFPATLSLIANVFTERGERAKAIGLWGATTGIGVATGPIVGARETRDRACLAAPARPGRHPGHPVAAEGLPVSRPGPVTHRCGVPRGGR